MELLENIFVLQLLLLTIAITNNNNSLLTFAHSHTSAPDVSKRGDLDGMDPYAGPPPYAGPLRPGGPPLRSSSGGGGLTDAAEEEDDGSPPPYVLSYVYLKHLASVEEKLYPLMSDYAQVLEKRLRIIQNYLKDYEDSSLKGTSQLRNTQTNPLVKATAVASHPLMAYRVVRRFSNEMKALERDFERNYEKEFMKKLTKLEGKHKWPGLYEHEQAMAGVLRVHYIYDMDIKEYTSGIIGGVDTGVGLTAKQTFHIAKFATYTNFYTLAMSWLGATSWKLRNSTNCDECKDVAANTVAMAYRNTIDKHNQELEENYNTTSNLYMFTHKIEAESLPMTIRNYHLGNLRGENFSLADVDVNSLKKGLLDTAAAEEDLDFDEDELLSAREVETEEEEDEEDAEAKLNAILELRSHFNYISLCNGEATQTEAVKSKLYCWYESKKHPYWYICPLKMELLNVEPYLVQMYEFVPDSWINYLIEKATPISNAPPPPTPEATPRSAAYAWLRDEDIEEIPLSLRIEHITGLHVRGQEASTDLQIASYVSGGHVANHVDSLGEGNDPRGDRVTTFLIYLNEVERGGYTAYPLLGTFVKPIKGSAILWYDSLMNGQIDNRMLHGACPPILGSKWIATKWTHLNENFLTRKCSTDPYK